MEKFKLAVIPNKLIAKTISTKNTDRNNSKIELFRSKEKQKNHIRQLKLFLEEFIKHINNTNDKQIFMNYYRKNDAFLNLGLGHRENRFFTTDQESFNNVGIRAIWQCIELFHELNIEHNFVKNADSYEISTINEVIKKLRYTYNLKFKQRKPPVIEKKFQEDLMNAKQSVINCSNSSRIVV